MKVRLISAVVALAILIPLLIIGGIPFAICASVLGVLAYKEVIDLKKSHNKIPDIVKFLGLFCLIYLIIGNYNINSIDIIMDYGRLLLPLVLLLLPTIFYKNEYKTNDAFYLIGTVYLIGMFFNLILSIRNVNIYLLIYLLGVAVLTDTFAYLIGILIGKHKMAPEISPKKSWEGAIGGLIGGSISSIIIYANLVDSFSIKLVIVTIILSIVGQLGDLVFSKIKRENNIKDFSNIMPGHGGIMDRIDSLSFIIFAYLILYSIL